jgi:hypothetical protein
MCEVIRGKDHHDTYLADYISFSLNQQDNILIQLQLDVNAYPIKLYVKLSAKQWSFKCKLKIKTLSVSNHKYPQQRQQYPHEGQCQTIQIVAVVTL